MGCCSSLHEIALKNPESYFSNQIVNSIKSNFHSYDIEYLSHFDKEEINKPLIQVGEIRTNALGISILVSDFRLMRYLIEHFQASFSSLEEQLESQNISLIEFLILNFNPDIFKYYIPIHLDHESENQVCSLEETLQFTSLQLPKTRAKVHPMRYATQIGNIQFLSFILYYFKNKQVHSCFDIHDIDEETGENCALVACAEGNLEMIHFLHNNNCDFKIKNKCKENAVNLVLAHMKDYEPKYVLAVIKFLIEDVKCDISDNYEESLMLSRHKIVTFYIEENLAKYGISVTKEIIEAKYKSSFSFENCEKYLSIDIVSMPSVINSVCFSDTSNIL